jgi:hypothetical protein
MTTVKYTTEKYFLTSLNTFVGLQTTEHTFFQLFITLAILIHIERKTKRR